MSGAERFELSGGTLKHASNGPLDVPTGFYQTGGSLETFADIDLTGGRDLYWSGGTHVGNGTMTLINGTFGEVHLLGDVGVGFGHTTAVANTMRAYCATCMVSGPGTVLTVAPDGMIDTQLGTTNNLTIAAQFENEGTVGPLSGDTITITGERNSTVTRASTRSRMRAHWPSPVERERSRTMPTCTSKRPRQRYVADRWNRAIPSPCQRRSRARSRAHGDRERHPQWRWRYHQHDRGLVVDRRNTSQAAQQRVATDFGSGDADQ